MRSMPVVRRALCTTAPPPAAKPPAFTPAQQILQSIKSMLPRVMTTGVVTHGEPIVYVEPKDVPIMLRFLRDHTGTRCKQLVDITAVDIPTREKRFEVGHTPTPPHTPPVKRTTHPLSPRASHPWLPLRQAAARWTSTHDLTPALTPPSPPPPSQCCRCATNCSATTTTLVSGSRRSRCVLALPLPLALATTT